jgi:hypothetical protein
MTAQLGSSRFWIAFVAVLLLLPLAACGGDDDDDDDEDEKEATPVDGTFVGKLSETDAFVAVVAAPRAEGQDRRRVTVFVCDGRRLCELFRGESTGNTFSAGSEDDDAEAKGELSAEEAKGTIEVGDDEPIRYQAAQATATSGLYDLTVSRNGRIRGASEAGVALRGSSTLPSPGTGRLRLADGTRLRFDIATGSADANLGLRPGQLRLIVLPDRKLAGAGMNRGNGADSVYFVRASK